MGISSFQVSLVLFMMMQSLLYALAAEYKSRSLIRCKTHELEALSMFKRSFTHDPMNRLSSWVGDDCCLWLGVTCDDATGNVIKLNLRGESNDFIGNAFIIPIIHCDSNALVSYGISPALLELKFLSHLDLSRNNFNGSRIPEFLGSMRHLRYLNLSAAGFSGIIPPQLGNLTNLIHLDLSVPLDDRCYFRYVHSESLGWVSGLTNLQSLNMSACDLSQAHDTFRVLTRLPSLLTLGLTECGLENIHLSKTIIMNTSTTFFSTLQHLDLGSNGFEGPLPSILKNMVSLQHLDLSQNGFKGPLPSNILKNMVSLQHLDLSYNSFEGPFPSILENMVSLQHLDLSNNGFEGPLPSSLENIVSLKYLSLRYNSFNGSIPLWLRKLSPLNVLDLSYNGFTYVEGGKWGIMRNPCNFKYLDLSGNAIVLGDILQYLVNSSTCAAYDLEHLSLPNTGINGTLPSQLGQLTNLKYLDLSQNELQGQVPASLSKLSALKTLDLSENQLSGLLPDVLGQLIEIEYLDISLNSLQGTVSGINNLSKLYFLDMRYNNLKLNLNFNRSPSFQLQVFNVHSCKINTVIPWWLRNQTRLEYLDLSYTGISGDLPEWLWNMTELVWLQLPGNLLTGSLPRHIVNGNNNLHFLDLHNNLLNGSIPPWLGDLEGIIVIDLSHNSLSGAIFEGGNASTFLSGQNSLIVLNLNDNMLFGEIQVTNGVPEAPSLQILNLGGNSFSGPISSQLCHFSYLHILDLARNRLTGNIPRCLGSLQFDSVFVDNSRYMYGYGYGNEEITDRSVVIKENIKGITEVFNGTMGIQSMIDLSSNLLVGTIPEELTNLSNLIELHLSNNQLTGNIPEEIGNLKLLESLDLSGNNLSGTIPQSLSAISGLGFLNLSYNHLHGPIPTDNHLQTLINPSNCAGNSGLCGFPLPNKCTKPDPPPTPTETDSIAGKEDDVEDKLDKMWFYLVIMSGVATGFWGVVGTLVLKKSWRHAYFRFMEQTGDRIYVPIKVRLNRLRNTN